MRQILNITCYLTSTIRKRDSSDIPAYGFFELTNEQRKQEAPVIFRIKSSGLWIDPDIARGCQVNLIGKWFENIKNKKSARPSLLAFLIK